MKEQDALRSFEDCRKLRNLVSTPVIKACGSRNPVDWYAVNVLSGFSTMLHQQSENFANQSNEQWFF